MALSDNLVAFWKLEEASGSRADAFGANTLTDQNTVTGNPGKIGNAAQFTAANFEYLTGPDNPTLSIDSNQSFCASLWFYADTVVTFRVLAGKGSATSGTSREWFLRIGSTSKVEMVVYDSAGANDIAVSLASLSSATWYHAYCERNTVSGKIGVSVNNETLVQTNSSRAITRATGIRFALGAGDGGGGNSAFNGRIDACGFWKGGVKDATDRSSLYNSGNGIEYPFAPPLPVFMNQYRQRVA